MNKKISVLIADDNVEFAEDLAQYIKAETDMEVAAVASDGDEAYKLIAETKPECSRSCKTPSSRSAPRTLLFPFRLCRGR